MNRKYHYLLTYIDQMNRMSKLFGPKKDPITLEACKELVVYRKLYTALDNDLSPENLCADGEIPRSQVKIKQRRLVGAWRDLNSLTGLAIDYDSEELEKWHDEELEEFRKEHKALSFLKPAVYLTKE